jgi:hypothetical protein
MFRNLFQLLPLLLVFLLYFLSPVQEEHYSLSRSPTFAIPMETTRLDASYFVKSRDAFEEAGPEVSCTGAHQRRRERDALACIIKHQAFALGSVPMLITSSTTSHCKSALPS